jgi:hypothetical protein
MSLDAMNAVWKHSEAKGNALLALLALADHADDEEYEAWPSLDHLAMKTRMGKRTVQDAVKHLLATNELTLVQRGTRGHTNVYRVEAAALRAKPSQVARSATLSSGRGGSPGGNAGGNLSATQSVGLESSGLESSVQPLFETEQVQSPAAESTATAPGSKRTEPPKVPAMEDPLVQEVWAFYVEVFGERLRIKTLTPPRALTIRKALNATGEDVDLMKRAISGLEAYRKSGQSSSTKVDLSVIFETNMHSQSNLTDQIEWWSKQAESIGAGEASMPSIVRERITSRKVEVVKMLKQPRDTGAQERGKAALEWLRENHHIDYRLADPDNPLTSRVEWIVTP